MGELRRSAWLVVAAAVVPLLLFVIMQAGFDARAQRANARQNALNTSQSIAVAMDGEVRRISAGLDAVATARSLRVNNLDEFRSRASELVGLNGEWRAVTLIDVPTDRPLIGTSAAAYQIQLTVRGAPGRGSRFIGFARGPGCPCLIFDREAVGPPGTRWAIRALVSNAGLMRLLPLGKQHYEVSAITDPSGRFLARSISDDIRFGNLGSVYLRGAANSGQASGTYRGFTLEGIENYTAFVRSPLTGWIAHAALPSEAIDSPARRFLASIGLAALLSLLLAGILIWFALRQVSEARRLSERLQQAQKLEALGQLTGGIAHDFNNLLTPVVGALDFVSRKPAIDPASKRLIDGALASARRAGKLTAQLLAFSRRQKLLIEPIDVAGMFDEMQDLLRQSVGTGHTLQILQDDRSLCALSDFNQLELAVLNLALNARDASPDGTPIIITTTATGTPTDGFVTITVRDQGSGMDEATRQRAIEPFFTTKEVGRGTGLGLAQVFGTAAQSGGELKINSEPGAGTEIVLTLRRCETATSRRTLVTIASDEDQVSRRLLVVDDDPLVRRAIVALLEEAGHIVDSVSDGATALTALAQRRFDLVLVDFLMPEMNGAELVGQGHAVRHDQRFLIVSGYADSEAIETASPDTPLIKKPFEPADLIAAVEHAIG